MNTIRQFIQMEVLLPRLRETGVLVVYDPAMRYRDLCLELASDTIVVVDASESSIESREAALQSLRELSLPTSTRDGLVVYVPTKRPLSDEEKQQDPFALYGACGRVFPSSDGDEYMALCLCAKADHTTEIRRVFQGNPAPDFSVIDAVGHGKGWPQLTAHLGVESAREILFALLAPTDIQLMAFKGQTGWVSEVKDLLLSTMGLRLMTRAQSWSPVADELWRFLLYSEFVFDLPVPLPDTLGNVPRAPDVARLVVEDLCERLRNDRRTQGQYIERAEAVERELALPVACDSIKDLGTRDTFPFEERSFFAQAVDALQRNNIDRVRLVLARHSQSIWIGRGENQSQWLLLQAATDLVQACDDAERQLPDVSHSQDGLIDYYLSSLRQVDRLQREFEQAATDQISYNHNSQLDDISRLARLTYRRLMDSVQTHFVKHLETTGWPPVGRLANSDVFDRLVAPLLQQSGRRVALLLIDALRYELGVELHKQLLGDYQVELQPAYAALPSVTPVGMASLLPGAGQSMVLVQRDGAAVPALGEQLVSNVSQRMGILQQRYGQRFQEVSLLDLVRKKSELPATVELLVVRSNEMDNDFESNPEAALSLIIRTFQQIHAALHKLRTMGFRDAVIATDHGFYLNTINGPGDGCGKPPGEWVNIHDRMLLGEGTGDATSWVLPAETLGVRGDFRKGAGPRAMVSYQAGSVYLHGGASLQEAVVPVLNVRLPIAESAPSKTPKVKLHYRRAGTRITTRLPVVDVSVDAGDLFSMDATVDILLEAQDKNGTVVGEAKPGGVVNPATRTISIAPGSTVQVTIKMELDFEGKFSIRALDPATLTTFDRLDLETDYTV